MSSRFAARYSEAEIDGGRSRSSFPRRIQPLDPAAAHVPSLASTAG